MTWDGIVAFCGHFSAFLYVSESTASNWLKLDQTEMYPGEAGFGQYINYTYNRRVGPKRMHFIDAQLVKGEDLTTHDVSEKVRETM